MKRLFIFLFLIFSFTVSSFCSNIFDDGGSNCSRNQFSADISLGKIPKVNGRIGVTAGVRYQYNVHRFIGIDCIGLNYLGHSIKGEGEDIHTLQVMSGLRGKTPCFYDEMCGYLGFRLGYGYEFNFEEGGLCTELNIGVHVTDHFCIGYVYNRQNIDLEGESLKLNFHGVKFGFMF